MFTVLHVFVDKFLCYGCLSFVGYIHKSYFVIILGYSSHVVQKFCQGFPHDWRSILSQHDTRFTVVDVCLIIVHKISNAHCSQCMNYLVMIN